MLRVGSSTEYFDRHLVSLLYIFGCWPKPNQSYRKIFLYYLQICIGVSYLCGVYVSIFLAEDSHIISNLVSLAILATLFIIRVFNFNRSWRGIQSSFVRLQDFVLHDTVEQSFIITKMPMIINLSAIFLFSHYFYVLSASIVPLFSSERMLPQNMMSFPLDWKNNMFFYILAYIYAILGMLVLVSMNALTSIYICYVMLMISLQLELLSRRIQKIGYNCRNQQSINALVDCIKLHKKIDMHIVKIEHYFVFSFLGEIAFGGINICVGAFSLLQVSIAQEPIRYINGFYELFISCVHILLPLYFGNEMILRMENLSFAVHQSNWTDQPYEFRKLAIIFLENLKNPRLILVAYVIPWNLETFTTILRFAYSSFNILQNLKK